MRTYLKTIGICFCVIGIIVYTSMLFMPNAWIINDDSPPLAVALLMMDVLMIIFICLLARKKKTDSPQKSLPKTPTVSADGMKESIMQNIKVSAKITNSDTPDEVLQSMRSVYTIDTAKDDLRILTDCVNIIKKTNNLDTFFSRYELGMQKVFTLEQAAKAGVFKQTGEISQSFSIDARKKKLRVLQASFQKELKDISALKTPQGKRNRWLKYLEQLYKYQSEYEFDYNDEYNHIVNEVKQQISK